MTNLTEISDLTIECFDRNKSYQKCYFKQYWSSWSTYQDASFSLQESPKFKKIRKIQRYDKSDRQKYFRLDHKVFWSEQKLSEIVFQTTYIIMTNFLFCTVLPPGASKVYQTRKLDDFFKSDTVIFNDTVQCFSRNQWCQ